MFDCDIPVYLITGFLESGKTTFMNNTLTQPYFAIRGRTLVIAGEQGEVGYDLKTLKRRHNTDVVFIDKPEDFTESALKNLDKKYKPDRVIIEFNPLWSVKKLYDMKLPSYWDMAQHIVIIDASSFRIYSQNMMPLITEMIGGADMVVFNRADEKQPLANFRRSIKVSNGAAQIIFEGRDGEQINIFQDSMPFDLEAPVIDIADEDFGIWYVDMMDNLERYLGKTVHFRGQVLKSRNRDADFFVPGRQAMTCCAEDMQFIGYVCQWPQTPQLAEGEWVEITGTIHEEFSVVYKDKGPVITVESLTKADKPQSELVYFT
ncbi:MAG: GTP-binding protein [Lachnospiraceae bacterium]|nr:GTP-binding protein [Lachnospiraceae bacterium]